MSGFRVEQHYWNCGGIEWTKVLPKVYARKRDAEAAARRWSWAVRPDGRRLIESSDARVVREARP